jgi:hypothetical protein
MAPPGACVWVGTMALCLRHVCTLAASSHALVSAQEQITMVSAAEASMLAQHPPGVCGHAPAPPRAHVAACEPASLPAPPLAAARSTLSKHSKTHPVGASAALTVIDRLPLCEHGPPLLRAPSMSLPPTNVVAYLRFRSFDSHGRRRDLRYADLAHAGVPSSEARGKCTPCNIRTTWRSERTIAEQPRWNRVAGRCTSSRLACGRPLRPPGRGGWSGSARARCKRV